MIDFEDLLDYNCIPVNYMKTVLAGLLFQEGSKYFSDNQKSNVGMVKNRAAI